MDARFNLRRSRGKKAVEYVWDLRQVPGLALEDSLPAWCDPEPWVQLSDFKTWAEVNQWASALFQITSPLSPDLSRKIAEWRQITSREQQILAVLRFVQDEVRYFGIEIGASTEKPADPSAVFRDVLAIARTSRCCSSRFFARWELKHIRFW